jgi:hypothetical protein
MINYLANETFVVLFVSMMTAAALYFAPGQSLVGAWLNSKANSIEGWLDGKRTAN